MNIILGYFYFHSYTKVRLKNFYFLEVNFESSQSHILNQFFFKGLVRAFISLIL